jgi:hypothetical protein
MPGVRLREMDDGSAAYLKTDTASDTRRAGRA